MGGIFRCSAATSSWNCACVILRVLACSSSHCRRLALLCSPWNSLKGINHRDQFLGPNKIVPHSMPTMGGGGNWLSPARPLSCCRLQRSNASVTGTAGPNFKHCSRCVLLVHLCLNQPPLKSQSMLLMVHECLVRNDSNRGPHSAE